MDLVVLDFWLATVPHIQVVPHTRLRIRSIDAMPVGQMMDESVPPVRPMIRFGLV